MSKRKLSEAAEILKEIVCRNKLEDNNRTNIDDTVSYLMKENIEAKYEYKKEDK